MGSGRYSKQLRIRVNAVQRGKSEAELTVNPLRVMAAASFRHFTALLVLEHAQQTDRCRLDSAERSFLGGLSDLAPSQTPWSAHVQEDTFILIPALYYGSSLISLIDHPLLSKHALICISKKFYVRKPVSPPSCHTRRFPPRQPCQSPNARSLQAWTRSMEGVRSQSFLSCHRPHRSYPYWHRNCLGSLSPPESARAGSRFLGGTILDKNT